MADVAHDASGPASPKPGDIAPQQVSRPDSADKGKLRVFISYSREDAEFADQLDAALSDVCGFECVIDRQGISGGEDWKRRLGNLISEADTVVFVLSPTSASEICTWEVEEAARLGKRILPVVCRPLEGARSQKDWMTWSRIKKLADDFLPQARILHPWPHARFAVNHSRWEPSALVGHARIWCSEASCHSSR